MPVLQFCRRGRIKKAGCGARRSIPGPVRVRRTFFSRPFLARIIKFLTDRSTANKAPQVPRVRERGGKGENEKPRARAAYIIHTPAIRGIGGGGGEGKEEEGGGKGGAEKPAGAGATVRREIMCHRVGTRHGLDDR